MKVTYDMLRSIELNSTRPFSGTPPELNTARVIAYQLSRIHPEENRTYSTKIVWEKGIIYITAKKANK